MVNKAFGKISIQEFLNRFTLIVGDIKSGKTRLAGQMLESYCETVDDRVAVIDLAPEITAQDLEDNLKNNAVGGRIQVPVSKAVSYHHARVHPPRLRAASDQAAEALAAENLQTIEALFSDALMQTSSALFINDCSLYLHAGSGRKLLEWIRSRPTSVVNGYYGRFFGNSSLSNRERDGMEFLMQRCDRLIRLS
jgi:hypothetical protein